MSKFTVIPESTFSELQLNAGVLLNKFTPATATAPADEDIICATTGGITVSCTPTFSDLGEDVDNCPKNTKELKHLDGWDCKMSTTALGTSPANIKLSLGCADVDGTDTTKIVPRVDLAQSDFSEQMAAWSRSRSKMRFPLGVSLSKPPTTARARSPWNSPVMYPSKIRARCLWYFIAPQLHRASEVKK